MTIKKRLKITNSPDPIHHQLTNGVYINTGIHDDD